MPYEVKTITSGATWILDTWKDVLQMMVESDVPYDPNDDDDLRVFAEEELDYETDDKELIREEIKEARNESAVTVMELEDVVNAGKTVKHSDFTIRLKKQRMEAFPKAFIAQKVRTEIEGRLNERANVIMKILRKKVVQACQGTDHIFIRVRYKFKEDDTKFIRDKTYQMIRSELLERGFVLHGVLIERILYMLICPGAVKKGKESNEWHATLQKFTKSVQEEHKRYKQKKLNDLEKRSLLTEVPNIEAIHADHELRNLEEVMPLPDSPVSSHGRMVEIPPLRLDAVAETDGQGGDHDYD